MYNDDASLYVDINDLIFFFVFLTLHRRCIWISRLREKLLSLNYAVEILDIRKIFEIFRRSSSNRILNNINVSIFIINVSIFLNDRNLM